MTTYKDAGVDRDLGDKCSEIAYTAAKKTLQGERNDRRTFKNGRRIYGRFGHGESFLLVQNEDGVGTKIEIAQRVNRVDTLGLRFNRNGG